MPFGKTVAAGLAVVLTLASLASPAMAQNVSFRTIFSPSQTFSQQAQQPAQPRRTQPLFASRSMQAPRAENRFARQMVAYQTREKAGTVVVDTNSKYLYLVMGNGQAMRYGIGVARPGFEWAGTHKVTQKREWPGWTPPAAMRKRQPHLPAYMEGGPDNPLGARALYLGSTLYRIHGTNDPSSIGQNLSSGCIRMVNDDVIDLYNRVPVGTRVIVI
ncbi:MAG: L,D-transpeptidase [Devosia sp.]